jgi:hypothetical protein
MPDHIEVRTVNCILTIEGKKGYFPCSKKKKKRKAKLFHIVQLNYFEICCQNSHPEFNYQYAVRKKEQKKIPTLTSVGWT